MRTYKLKYFVSLLDVVEFGSTLQRYLYSLHIIYEPYCIRRETVRYQ